jgi:hypothetical protein
MRLHLSQLERHRNLTLSRSKLRGREANTRVQQQLERERLAAQKRERALEQQRALERSRG